MYRRVWLPLAFAAAAVPWLRAPAAGDGAQPPPVVFNRDIRPILSDNCFTCHGPDQAKRQADLRLDLEESALADRDGRRVIVPGKPEESELYWRITADRAGERMPPAKSGKQLTRQQIDLIRRWIAEGAKWQKHWAFIPPTRPPLPRVQDTSWPRNAIDYFVLARLEHEGLRPSPEADKATLIRRVSLDLTGLPPTLAEVDAFLADTRPDAYERLVDRLLASPRYGERMARPWLDAARYADTNGYQSDGERTMWRWRDWVIDAFNANLPFDQFTIEQLAGDLLPNPTLDQRIATGFNRNHRGNAEGGIIPEEYAVEYVVDRVDTTATVWLGLTFACARCHDHKYDPISQQEFYQVFAFFNNVPERGKAVKFGNSPPMIKSPTRDQQEQLRRLEQQLAAAEDRFARLQPAIARAQADWERSLAGTPPIQWFPADGLLAHDPLDGGTAGRWYGGEPAYAPGRLGQAARCDGRRYIDAGNIGDFGFDHKFSLAALVRPDADERGSRRAVGGTILSRMTDVEQGDGYSVVLANGKLQVNLVKRWLDDAIRVETEDELPAHVWTHILVTYDGSRVASGVMVYLNGRPARLKVLLDDLNQSFQTKEPLRIGAGGGPEGRFHGSIDEVRVYHTALSADEAEGLATVDTITAIAATPPDQRTGPQARKLRAYFLAEAAPAPIRQAYRELSDLRKARAQLIESFPTTMVMEELATPRDTFVLIRGQYDKRGAKVAPGVPAVLGPNPAEMRLTNRLDFARWLVAPTNPLTARVAVNRSWQMVFGTGLVKTAEDFGAQGEPPSHPELLDWLAVEFRESGWDVKALHRTIVTSATYRQSSRVTPALLHKDPENRLLARGPRFRLPAEMIRDQALYVSGLLVERIGGPSVKPYQPPGLIKDLTGTEDYQQSHGADLYRRSLYTFWKRTVAPPQMITFDAAGREACSVREMRTNTPLQALNLMNDVTFVEAARVLAQRIMTEAGPTPEARIAAAFRLATAREPRPAELAILVAGFHHHLAAYRQAPRDALQLVSAGEAPRDPKLDVPELAAYTAVASLILNLDEVITKE